MGIKNNNIYILPIVLNVTTYNLVCVFIMIGCITFMILVTMVIILAGKYGLPSYQHIYIYKMEKCHLLAISTVLIYMSVEPAGHQHSETCYIFLMWHVD